MYVVNNMLLEIAKSSFSDRYFKGNMENTGTPLFPLEDFSLAAQLGLAKKNKHNNLSKFFNSNN